MELVRRKLVGSRSEAQRAIRSGLVRVGTNTSPKAATMVAPKDPVYLEAAPDRFVSRAGQKLYAAIETFGLDVAGVRAIDVGASTGGFTDCLLQRDVSTVTAVDVGYGQLHWRIRNDSRVTVVERTNIRTADIQALGAPFDLVVADLSFISLRTVRDQLADLGTEVATWVLLVKPQFEVGRDDVGKGGIVRDSAVRVDALVRVLDAYQEIGLGCMGLIESPIRGATGNVEYVACFTRGSGTVTSETVDQALEETQP